MNTFQTEKNYRRVRIAMIVICTVSAVWCKGLLFPRAEVPTIAERDWLVQSMPEMTEELPQCPPSKAAQVFGSTDLVAHMPDKGCTLQDIDLDTGNDPSLSFVFSCPSNIYYHKRFLVGQKQEGSLHRKFIILDDGHQVYIPGIRRIKLVRGKNFKVVKD